jgi:drug/metabolite transporter (DMT)-like permease
MNNENQSKVLDIVKKVITWGLGALIAIAGVVFMFLHKQLDVQYPYWLIAGIILVCLGVICYLITYILSKVLAYKLSKNTNQEQKT